MSTKSGAVTIYTCPMHPQIQQDHPGACPLGGMALEPMTATLCACTRHDSDA